MRQYNIIALFLTLIVFSQCKRERAVREIFVDESLFKVVQFEPKEYDYEKNEISFISTLAQGVTYIPLETSDTVLIGKIEKLLIWDSNFYIWDRMTESIFCFDSLGNYQFKINKFGQGPEDYPAINDFFLDTKSGNIYIRSDEGKGIYVFTNRGRFIKKISVDFVTNSFAIQDDKFLFYSGKLPNEYLFYSTFPEQYRYFVMKQDTILFAQLKFKYNKDYGQIPSSISNFTTFNDTILLSEDLQPEIYSVNDSGQLVPRYRIEFLSNDYNPGFEQGIDLQRYKDALNNKEFTHLWLPFFENDKYLFVNYSNEYIGFLFVNKDDNTVHNLGYALFDDFNMIPMDITILFADNQYLYMETEPYVLVGNLLPDNQGIGRLPEHLKNVINNIQDSDNPVIVKIKLR
jgi:hypothetical protein